MQESNLTIKIAGDGASFNLSGNPVAVGTALAQFAVTDPHVAALLTAALFGAAEDNENVRRCVMRALDNFNQKKAAKNNKTENRKTEGDKKTEDNKTEDNRKENNDECK